LIGVTHTEEQAKALAASVEIKDGPDDEGEYFMRKGKLFDAIPAPYPNEAAARFANNGAYPPDLSCVVKARHGEEDYVYSLLTGYRDPPHGVTVREGLYYNPYFPGGSIAMAPPLSDGQVEFEDGTVSTISQAAKDVTTFLMWASFPEYDSRKKKGSQLVVGLVFAGALVGYWKRFRFASLKSRRVTFVEHRGKPPFPRAQ